VSNRGGSFGRGFARLRWFLLGQQFSLGEIRLTDYQLTRKDSAFLNRDRFRGNVPFEHRVLMNRHVRFRYNLAQHPPFNFNTGNSDPPEELNIRFAFYGDVLRRQPSRNLPDEVDGRGTGALQISAQFSFDQRGPANYTRAAEVPFGRKMQVAARANASAEASGDFVIAQIDVCAAPRAIGRGSCVTDFVFSLAFKARDGAAPLPMPKAFRFPKTSGLWLGCRLLFRPKL